MTTNDDTDATIRSSAASPEQPPLLWRAIFPMLCVAAPLIVYLGIFRVALAGLQPDPRDLVTLGLVSITTPPILSEFPRRLNFGITSVLLITACLTAAIYCAHAFWRHRGTRMAVGLCTLALIFGAIVFLADEYVEHLLRQSGWHGLAGLVNQSDTSIGESMRFAAVTAVLAGIGHSDVALDADLLHHIYLLAATTGAVGVTAVTLLACRFAEIAWRDSPAADPVVAIQARWSGFRVTLVLGALVLVLSVAANKAFYAWPLALLDDASANAYAAITDAAVGFWGILYTTILIAVVTPTVVALASDIEQVAEHHGETPEKRAAWRKAHNLILAPREAISSVLAIAAPLLTSPAIDAVKSAFGG